MMDKTGRMCRTGNQTVTTQPNSNSKPGFDFFLLFFSAHPLAIVNDRPLYPLCLIYSKVLYNSASV